jgi:hypothetical protein
VPLDVLSQYACSKKAKDALSQPVCQQLLPIGFFPADYRQPLMLLPVALTGQTGSRSPQFGKLDRPTGSTHNLEAAAVSPDMNTQATYIGGHLQALSRLPFCLPTFCSGLGLLYKHIILYFSGILHNDTGTSGVTSSEIPRRQSISPERLQAIAMSVKIRQGSNVLPMILRHFLPAHTFSTSLAPMYGPPLMTALILWFILMGEHLCLEGGDVVIKLREMGGKGARLGFFAGYVVEKG